MTVSSSGARPVRMYSTVTSLYPIDMPQNSTSSSGGDTISATVLRTCDLRTQQHDRLQIHSEVGPLGQAQVAVDVADRAAGAPKDPSWRWRLLAPIS